MIIAGEHFAWTLEDKDRGLKQSDSLLTIKAKKIFGKTAIPTGKYEVILSYSNRFKKVMPLLLDVKGFDGVRIHGGNTDADTLGCPLIGEVKVSNGLGIAQCRKVNEDLIGLLKMSSDTKNWVIVE